MNSTQNIVLWDPITYFVVHSDLFLSAVFVLSVGCLLTVGSVILLERITGVYTKVRPWVGYTITAICFGVAVILWNVLQQL